jgi:hypothetical protein
MFLAPKSDATLAGDDAMACKIVLLLGFGILIVFLNICLLMLCMIHGHVKLKKHTPYRHREIATYGLRPSGCAIRIWEKACKEKRVGGCRCGNEAV